MLPPASHPLRGRPATGAGIIAFAFGFNGPYALLAATFSYPGILREDPALILAAFAAGGDGLILIWYSFAAFAIGLVPLALILALQPRVLDKAPGIAIAAAVLGALAGVTQAMGLLRWALVVPALASSPEAAAAPTLAVLNLYGGVAIGEHLGQWLTAGFAGAMALAHGRLRERTAAGLAAGAAVFIAIGTGEGLALALGKDGAAFSVCTIIGFLLLTLWLIAAGLMVARPQRPV